MSHAGRRSSTSTANTRPAAPAAPRADRPAARFLTADEPSRAALSESFDSSAATSTCTARSQQDAGPPHGLAARCERSPQRNPAREFQVRPQRERSPLASTADDLLSSKSMSIPPIVRKTLMDFDRIQKLKMAAERAIRDKKVFMIHGGYPSIRLALKRRGWVEKKYLINRNESEDEIDVSRWPIDNDTVNIGLSEVISLKGSKNSMIMTRLLRDNQPNLIWSAKREVIDYMNLERDQLVNHFQRAPFNTKIGLCSLAQGLHWYSESMPALTFIPRAFRIGMAEEKQEFVDDFRLTACVSVLVWFKERFELHGPAGVEDLDGEVPYSVIPTALQQCQAFIAVCEHEDIEPSAFNRALWPHQWDNFMTNIYKIIHKKKKLEMHHDENSTIVKVFYNRILQLLKDLTQYRPQTRLDGCLNIWIVKPGSASRGRGIILLRQLENILALVDSATQREGKYVVQKYCERPMLIYNTKFDIRQWFLVTDWNPLTVWMYKQSYLRFSSQQFNLNDLKEAIHLCNNAVQSRYRNGDRHAALPTENMWDSSTFQQFLKSREAGDAWDQIIYPNMKNAIISICMASQTELEPRKGCFELFGADFLLTEDYHPWLIEVNSSPAMGATTSVTAWLCAMCLEDTIRVIVDRRKDATADVGEFECILQQPVVSSPRYLGIDLSLHGHRIKPPASQPPPPAAPPAESPPEPRASPVQSSLSVRGQSRLTTIPASQTLPAVSYVRSPSQAPPTAAAVASHSRSRSQVPSTAAAGAAIPPTAAVPPTAAAGTTAGTAAGTAAGTGGQRRRSQSRAASVARRGSIVSTTVTTPRAPPPPPTMPPASTRPRQRTAARKGATASRRRSRTQLIQSSVRRLSAPRRSRSSVKQKMAAVAAAAIPPAAPGPISALVRPAAGPARSRLEFAVRRPAPKSPRAQQLVTAGQSARCPLWALAGSETRLVCPVSEPLVGGAGRAPPQSTAASATCLHRPASESTNAAGTVHAANDSSVGQVGSHFLTSSLDKLERIKTSSAAAVHRITSLSVTPATPPPITEGQTSSMEVLEVRQMGKVKWVVMPAVHSVHAAPAAPSVPPSDVVWPGLPTARPGPSASVAALPPQTSASLTPKAAPPAPGPASPAANTSPRATRDVTAAPRPVSPAGRAAVLAPGLVAPIPCSRWPPPTAPATRSLSPTTRSRSPGGGERRPALVSPYLTPSWGTPVGYSLSREAAQPATPLEPWQSAAARSASLPSPQSSPSLSPRLPTLPADSVSSGPVSVSPGRSQCSPRAQQQQAFNTRIAELKDLIDRAIEETREFLGRGRTPPPRASVSPRHPRELPPPLSPRPRVSPVVVDVAARRPAGSPPDAAWERRGEARFGACRPSSGRRAPASPGAEARLTELVGMQGRRFLPQLPTPEPSPRRTR